MATEQAFVEYVQAQSGLDGELSYKKMFGEYALYLHGKVVAFACDNQLFVKPTDAGRSLLGKVSEHPPYPGAKLYFRIDDEMEDRELLQSLLHTTARALPPPKAKEPRARRAGAVKAVRTPPRR
jgi:TfoX/Sxy family transcriptional regulator of competence genes